jgi:hypothetical protein
VTTPPRVVSKQHSRSYSDHSTTCADGLRRPSSKIDLQDSQKRDEIILLLGCQFQFEYSDELVLPCHNLNNTRRAEIFPNFFVEYFCVAGC